MKYAFLLVLVISMLWELSFASGNFFLDFYKAGFGSAMWAAAFIYLYDFFMAMAGKNSAYMIEFYSQLKKDIAVCLVSGLTLFFLFLSLPSSYTFSNIDLAFLGVPFLFYSGFEIVKSGKLKVANQKMPRNVILGLMAILICTYALFVYLLRQILTNSFSQSQALWYQITISFTGLYAFFATNQLRFYLEKQRLEVSPVLMALFASIKSSPAIYKDAAQAAEVWNDELRKKKRGIRKMDQRKPKSKRKA